MIYRRANVVDAVLVTLVALLAVPRNASAGDPTTYCPPSSTEIITGTHAPSASPRVVPLDLAPCQTVQVVATVSDPDWFYNGYLQMRLVGETGYVMWGSAAPSTEEPFMMPPVHPFPSSVGPNALAKDLWVNVLKCSDSRRAA